MNIYTSRFTNPKLRDGDYTTVRISVGTPRWNIGYRIDGEVKDIMPFGLLGKYDNAKNLFRQEYFKRLETAGVEKIMRQLEAYASKGKPVVLLCYEDVRKGENDWCHRVMFAEWWLEKTGEVIEELDDPTAFKAPKAPTSVKKPETPIIPTLEQISLF